MRTVRAQPGAGGGDDDGPPPVSSTITTEGRAQSDGRLDPGAHVGAAAADEPHLRGPGHPANAPHRGIDGQHMYLALTQPCPGEQSLGGGLPDRLVATVVAEWIRRLPDEAGDDVDARLYAALYGRAAAAVRAWLGRPDGPVEVDMIGSTTSPSLSRDGDRTMLRLPFSWLGDVWIRGLATIMGRFVLSATATGNGHWSLLTIGPEDEPAKTFTIQPG
jgi:hypothetical protein